jgi:enoyl-CoA hydratase
MSVLLSREGDAMIVRLDRPKALNALSFSVLEMLDDAFDQVAQSNARVLVVTGSGEKAFCAGADIKELRNRDLVAERRGIEMGQAVFEKIGRLPMPSLAFINGYAFGGGLELAMACTFRLAAPNAKVGLPEIKLGLMPGYGGTQRLPRLIGEARALDLVMTGRTVAAEEALQMGLVNAIVDDLAAALEYCQRFTCYSLPTLGFARAAVERALDLPIHAGLKVEADLATLAFRTEDAVEGMAAFEDKRQAEFKDR